MKKSERMEKFVRELETNPAEEAFDACYLGYFRCFNSGSYYEAHDVLEHLWLKEGRDAPDHAYYKGLIQLAGGFVHLKLHHTHPEHPKHGRRLHPARRLFLMAESNLAAYGHWHRGLDLDLTVSLARGMAFLLEGSRCNFNPWSPESAPVLPNPVVRKDSD